jgi:hypothetical protein
MKRKCKVCFKGNINALGVCDECGAGDISGKEKSSQYLFYGRCELCGNEGRIIERGEGKTKVVFYRCYECWQKDFYRERVNRARANNCPVPNTKHGLDVNNKYLLALEEHFHKPRFYNRQPNWIMIQQASWELLKHEVKEDVRQVMQAFQDKRMANLLFKK